MISVREGIQKWSSDAFSYWMENINVGPGVNKPSVIACGADSGRVNCLNTTYVLLADFLCICVYDALSCIGSSASNRMIIFL